MRKVIIISMAAILSLSLVLPTLAAELEGVINVNLSSTNIMAWEAVAEEYMKLNPGVKVNVELKPGEGYQEWIRSQFAAGVPEASLVNGNVVWDLVNAGKFLDYLPYLDKINPYTDESWGEGFDVRTQMAAGMSYWGGARRWCQFNAETVQVLWFYNKGIFEEVGVEPPTTWSELMDTCEKIKQAGYIPLAIEGDYTSFWSMRIGWLMRIYADQFTRDEIKFVRCQPDDYCYDEEIDAKWEYDPNDPFNDDPGVVNFNPLRKFKAILDGKARVDGDEWRTMYENFYDLFSKYTEPGFVGVSDAYPLFLTQKAAMWIDGAWFIGRFEKDLEDLSKTEGAKIEPFEYGSFNMPTMEGPYVQGPIRTIEVAIGFISVPEKARKQNNLEMDFLMFFTSPKGYGIYLTKTLDPNNPGGSITGPPIIGGVELPPDLAKKFAGLRLIGNCEKETAGAWRSRGLADEQESVRGWVDLAQLYFTDKITLDEFLAKYQKSIEDAIPRVMKIQGYELSDLDTPEKKPPERKK